MTKMKSKKMTKSTFAVIIMAVAMVAMLAFGGTYAYFTSTAKTSTTTFTTGVVQLKNTTEASTLAVATTTDIVPGAYIYGDEDTFKTLSLDATGTTADIYVFIEVAASTYTLQSGKTLEELLANPSDSSIGSITDITINNTGTDKTDGGAADDESVLNFIVDEDCKYVSESVNGWQLVPGETDVYYMAVSKDALADLTNHAFGFTLQFDERVHADRVWDETESEWVETENTSADSIMGVNVYVQFKIASIQQLTYESDVAGAYTAAFTKVADRT